MSSDTPPPQKPQQLSANFDSARPSASALHSMPTSAHSSRPGSADPAAAQGPAAGNELQSQPMTATSSTDATGTDSATPSGNQVPYGTRSRGRNAAPRPNYAEDRDIDMDFEVANSAPKPAKRVGRPPSEATERDAKRAVGDQVAPWINFGSTYGPVSSSKDSIPGTSSFSAKADDGNRSTSSSKKRKQPASTPNSNSANGNVAKKIFTAATGPAQETESNMVSFETHGTHLKDGKLTADDGTVYAPNGSLPLSIPCL